MEEFRLEADGVTVVVNEGQITVAIIVTTVDESKIPIEVYRDSGNVRVYRIDCSAITWSMILEAYNHVMEELNVPSSR